MGVPYPAPQQFIGCDTQGPPVNWVRVPWATIHVHLEDLRGCGRHGRENVTEWLSILLRLQEKEL